MSTTVIRNKLTLLPGNGSQNNRLLSKCQGACTYYRIIKHLCQVPHRKVTVLLVINICCAKASYTPLRERVNIIWTFIGHLEAEPLSGHSRVKDLYPYFTLNISFSLPRGLTRHRKTTHRNHWLVERQHQMLNTRFYTLLYPAAEAMNYELFLYPRPFIFAVNPLETPIY